ncbi:hypothetical protein [Brucella sp.]|uniref:hypothetical protein n=1 Tax=Brucella sp. TaxID=52132 RepID=UPI0028AE5E68|nr:hypothetical protein [Brucella sp.]
MKLTRTQRLMLSNIADFENGRGLSFNAISWAPIKRLIKKRAIVKNGSRKGFVFYKITPEGRQALKGGE